MNHIRKFFTGAIRAVNKDRFTVDAVMSDETKDRYDEVIKAEAWKKRLGTFKKHPVLLSSHEYRGLRNQIGMWEKVWVEKDALVGRAKYFVNEGNPEADWAFKLAEKGIAAFSVGFIAHEFESLPYDEWEKNKKLPIRIYTDVELLETSQVTIPANPSALMKMSFEDGSIERDLVTKAHDTFTEDEMFDIDQALDVNTKFLVKGDNTQYDNFIKEQDHEKIEDEEVDQKEAEVTSAEKETELEKGEEHENISEELAIEGNPVGLEGKGTPSGESEESELIEVNIEEKIRQAIQDEIRHSIEEIKAVVLESINSLRELILGETTSIVEDKTTTVGDKEVLISDLIKAVGISYVEDVLTNDKKADDKAVKSLLDAVSNLTSGFKEVK